MREPVVTDAETDRKLKRENKRERDCTEAKRQPYAESRMERDRSGITECCNRLESHQLGSAQVGLAADFLAVSLPTTAHGNMILQQTQNNPRRSYLAGFGRKKILNNRSNFPRGFILA